MHLPAVLCHMPQGDLLCLHDSSGSRRALAFDLLTKRDRDQAVYTLNAMLAFIADSDQNVIPPSVTFTAEAYAMVDFNNRCHPYGNATHNLLREAKVAEGDGPCPRSACCSKPYHTGPGRCNSQRVSAVFGLTGPPPRRARAQEAAAAVVPPPPPAAAAAAAAGPPPPPPPPQVSSAPLAPMFLEPAPGRHSWFGSDPVGSQLLDGVGDAYATAHWATRCLVWNGKIGYAQPGFTVTAEGEKRFRIYVPNQTQREDGVLVISSSPGNHTEEICLRECTPMFYAGRWNTPSRIRGQRVGRPLFLAFERPTPSSSAHHRREVRLVEKRQLDGLEFYVMMGPTAATANAATAPAAAPLQDRLDRVRGRLDRPGTRYTSNGILHTIDSVGRSHEWLRRHQTAKPKDEHKLRAQLNTFMALGVTFRALVNSTGIDEDALKTWLAPPADARARGEASLRACQAGYPYERVMSILIRWTCWQKHCRNADLQARSALIAGAKRKRGVKSVQIVRTHDGPARHMHSFIQKITMDSGVVRMLPLTKEQRQAMQHHRAGAGSGAVSMLQPATSTSPPAPAAAPAPSASRHWVPIDWAVEAAYLDARPVLTSDEHIAVKNSLMQHVLQPRHRSRQKSHLLTQGKLVQLLGTLKHRGGRVSQISEAQLSAWKHEEPRRMGPTSHRIGARLQVWLAAQDRAGLLGGSQAAATASERPPSPAAAAAETEETNQLTEVLYPLATDGSLFTDAPGQTIRAYYRGWANPLHDGGKIYGVDSGSSVVPQAKGAARPLLLRVVQPDRIEEAAAAKKIYMGYPSSGRTAYCAAEIVGAESYAAENGEINWALALRYADGKEEDVLGLNDGNHGTKWLRTWSHEL